MELNYPQQPNGMYVLNGNDLEHIATGVLSEFFPITSTIRFRSIRTRCSMIWACW